MLEDHSGTTRLSTTCLFDATLRRDTVTIRLHGEFDLACEKPFEEELGRHVDNATSRLVLDLRELTFMDSTGLAMLLRLDAFARRDGLDLEILCRVDGPVRRVLRETGLDGVLPVADSFGLVPATDSPV